MIGDRLFRLMDRNNNEMIQEKVFVDTLVKVFMSEIETRMKVTFDM